MILGIRWNMAARFLCCTFASPLLLALLGVPACHTAPAPRHPVALQLAEAPVDPAPPAPSDPAAPEPPDFQPPPPPVQVLANPPVPVQGHEEQASWTVFRGKDGCLAEIDVACPTGEPGKPMAACHPMPPFRVACPEGLQHGRRISVITFGDSCTADLEPMHCPPHEPCRPPLPRIVPCPKP